MAAVQAFAAIADQTREDVYVHPHVRYYVREVRVVAYSQVSPKYTEHPNALSYTLLMRCMSHDGTNLDVQLCSVSEPSSVT